MENTEAQSNVKATTQHAATDAPRKRGRPRLTEQRQTVDVHKKSRDLAGLEKHFKDVVINSGFVFVTVDEDIKKVKRDLVTEFGPRRNSRTNVEKQAENLTLRRFREMFDLTGRHLTLKFIEEHDGELVDERGKKVIHFQPQAS